MHFFAFFAVQAVFVFVVPEHYMVAQEAGIDLYPIAMLFARTSQLVLQFWYLLVVGFLLADGLVVTWFAWCGWWKALILFNYAVLMGSLFLVLLVSTCMTVPLQLL
jgi:hypothetical protein